MKEMPGITQETKKKASGGTTGVAVAMATDCAVARCRCHSVTGLDFLAAPASAADSRTSGRGWAGRGPGAARECGAATSGRQPSRC